MGYITPNRLAAELGISESGLNNYMKMIASAAEVSDKEKGELRLIKKIADRTGMELDIAGLIAIYRRSNNEARQANQNLKKYLVEVAKRHNDREAFEVGYNNQPIPNKETPELKNQLPEFNSVQQESKQVQSASKIEAYYQRLREGKVKPAQKNPIAVETLIGMKKAGLTYEEIAMNTGLSRSTVYNRIKQWKEANNIR